MVLEYLGVAKTEEELRSLVDSTGVLGGTRALLIVDAAKQLGFPSSEKHNLEFQELLWVLSQGCFPIVYIMLRLQPNTPLQNHAVVITGIGEEGVRMLDPVRGEVIHTADEFIRMWTATRGLTILIQ